MSEQVKNSNPTAYMWGPSSNITASDYHFTIGGFAQNTAGLVQPAAETVATWINSEQHCLPVTKQEIDEREFALYAVTSLKAAPQKGHKDLAVVAFGSLMPISDNTGYWELASLVTGPQYRGKGVGSAMVEALTSFFKEYGDNRFEDLCLVSGPNTVQFYVRHGFTEVNAVLKPDHALFQKQLHATHHNKQLMMLV